MTAIHIPEGFRYKDILLSGKPQHIVSDEFRRRHPFMDTGRRAKIFAPFDALVGFSELILSKETVYVKKYELDEEREEMLNRRTDILSSLIRNSKDAREKKIIISVKYYVPCSDMLSDAYENRGSYVTVSGIVQQVDTVFCKLKVNDVYINFENIYDIDSEIFRNSEKER